MAEGKSFTLRKTLRFVLTAIGLGIIGLAFSLGGALLGGRVIAGNSPGFAALGLAISGMLLGYPVGVIISLVLLKRLLHQAGSLWLGIAGCFVGLGIWIISATIFRLDTNSTLLLYFFFLIVPVLSLAGFQMKKQQAVRVKSARPSARRR